MYNQEKLFTMKEASHFLNISLDRLSTIVRRGQINFLRESGKTLFCMQDLAAFLNDTIVQPFVGKATWDLKVEGEQIIQGENLW